MDRREFLKSMFGVMALASVPSILVEDFVSGTQNTFKCNGIVIDLEKKIISIIPSVYPNGITTLQLYYYVNKLWQLEDAPLQITY